LHKGRSDRQDDCKAEPDRRELAPMCDDRHLRPCPLAGTPPGIAVDLIASSYGSNGARGFFDPLLGYDQDPLR
jgi:hypothetical protein